MRLLTRFDFDGVCCAALLREVGVVDTMDFIHPKELQDGNVEVSENDVLANVPLVPGCGLWFDHHSSESERMELEGKFKGVTRPAPSAARVIYEYYGGKEKLGKFEEMMKYVDKVDSADLTPEEIQDPEGWVLVGFITDPRTGLAAYQGYRIPHYQFMFELVEMLRSGDINSILANPDLKERAERYRLLNEDYKEFIKKTSWQDGPVVVTDTRNMKDIPPGNRFLIYSMFPETNISIRLMDGKGQQNVVLGVGHSVLNRTSKVNVGSLMLRYGGGGHERVGTCQVGWDEADEKLKEIIGEIKKTEVSG